MIRKSSASRVTRHSSAMTYWGSNAAWREIATPGFMTTSAVRSPVARQRGEDQVDKLDADERCKQSTEAVHEQVAAQ